MPLLAQSAMPTAVRYILAAVVCHIADSVSYDGFICVPADGDI